jgi:signal transduction histidine kinase
MNEKSTENGKELRWFLIKRFLIIMAGIYGSTELLSALYRNVVLPALFLIWKQREIHITSQAGILELMLELFVFAAADFLPDAVAGIVKTWIGEALGNAFQISVKDVLARGRWGMVLQIAFLLVVFVLLFVSILPYLVGAFVYYRMVTRKVNELMEQEKEQQRAFDRKRNLLLSDIAHDIKTPITTICGYSRALSDGVVDREREQEYLDAIYAKSMRMSELVTLLFEYVKLDSEGYVLHREKLDFAELVRENAAMVYPDYEEKKISVEVDVPEETVFCDADRLQMGRAVMNLLTNAARYGKPGGKVLIRLRERTLVVADDGLVIEPEFAEHIFEPFTRADKARTTHGGSGLGLSISAKVVEMHGGKLELDCAYGMGYTKAFVLRLPEE